MKTIVTILSFLIALPLISLASTEDEVSKNSDHRKQLYEGIDSQRVQFMSSNVRKLKLSISIEKNPQNHFRASALSPLDFTFDYKKDMHTIANAKLNHQVLDIYQDCIEINADDLSCNDQARKKIIIVARNARDTDNILRDKNEEIEKLQSDIKTIKKELNRAEQELKSRNIKFEIQLPRLYFPYLLIIE